MSTMMTESIDFEWMMHSTTMAADEDGNINLNMDADLDWRGTESPWPPGEVDEQSNHGADSGDLVQCDDHERLGTSRTVPTAALVAESEMNHYDDTDTNYTTAERQPDDSTADNETSTKDDETALVDELATKYELRPQTRAINQSFTSTWIDEEQTGNYDPDEESRRERAKRARVKARELERFSAVDSEDSGEVTEARGPVELPRLIIHLKFASDTSKAALHACLSKVSARYQLEYDDFSDGYRLRKTTGARAAGHGEALHLNSKSSDQDPLSDLTGHPEARGCKGCLQLGIRCPLLDEERSWPCYTCLEDETDCELIIEPARKRVCERCKRRRIACSYGYSVNHSGPCQDCEDDGHDCVAGPAKDAVPTRIRYDRDWTADPLPVKKAGKTKTYWTCMQCRESRRECSFANGANGEDCTACEMAGNICIPEQETTTSPEHSTSNRPALPQKRKPVSEPVEKPQPPRKRPKLSSRRDSKIEIPDSLPPSPPFSKPSKLSFRRDSKIEIPDSPSPPLNKSSKPAPRKGRKIEIPDSPPQPPSKSSKSAQRNNTKPATPPNLPGETKKITTKFCHPIVFNNETADGTTNCNFCDHSSLAILGLEPRVVEVIDWNDGRGLTELSGGHMAEGIPKTRMCTTCTMQRMSIILCQSHTLRPIPNSHNQLLDAEGALMALFAGETREKDQWCSLCPALAGYECDAAGSLDQYGRMREGCGLVLCETCMVELTGVYEGKLQEMLGEVGEEGSESRPLGMRADAGFLGEEGLLMRFVLGASK